MCNHIGSYIINDVLKAIIDAGIGKEKMQEVTLKILEVGKNYDCNDTEILNEVAKDCGICNFCSSVSEDIDNNGLCVKCRQDK
jgi:recombinational DNA repair protein RecR